MSAFRKFGAALSDSSLQKFSCELTSCAQVIGREAIVLMHERNEEEAQANSRFRNVSTRFFKSASSQQTNQQILRARQRVLDFCCEYDYMVAWKQVRKAGSTNLFLKCPHYKAWRDRTERSPLVYTARLGAGKSVMLASIVDDLHLHAASKDMTVAFFFARHDVAESLKARTAIGSLVRQLLSQVMDLRQASEILETTSHRTPFERMLDLLQSVLKPDFKAFFVIDGLDELSTNERELFLRDLYNLKVSFQLSVCLSFRQEPNTPLKIGPESPFDARIVSIPPNISEIETFITEELTRRVESRKLEISDPLLPLEIRDSLVKGSQGMFLWVALQIESLCTMQTDAEIRHALSDLPEDLSETSSRALQRANKPGSPYQKRILELITVAQRQLTAEELREALSVTPGDTDWNPSQILNNIYSTLACCGGLVVLDEEELTLHLVHNSVKQYLTSGFSHPADNMVDLVNAHGRMSDIIITYLHYAEFANQVSQQVIPEVNASLAMDKIISSASHTLNDSRTLALRLLRKKTPLDLNIAKSLANVWNPRHVFEKNTFLDNYANTFWLSHLTSSFPLSSQITPLFQTLCERNVLSPIESSDDVKLLFERAVATSSVELAVHLINTCNADVNCKLDSNGRTALHLSVMYGFSELTELLLTSENIDVGATDLDNETPMRLAAKMGYPLIYLAAKCGNEKLVTQLISHSEKEKTHAVTIWNTIEKVAVELRLEMVNLLLGFDSTPHCEHAAKGTNPLHHAVQQGHEELTRCLLQSQKVNPQAVDGLERTAYMLAVQYEHEAIYKMLLKEDVSRWNTAWALEKAVGPDGATPVHIAARLGWASVMNLVIATVQVDLNRLDPHGLTPLLSATKYGQREIVEALMHAPDVDISVTDRHGNTALHLAVQCGHYDILILLTSSTNLVPSSKSVDGNTPLHLAASAGQIDAARLLVSTSIYTDMVDVISLSGRIPLDLAIEGKHFETVNFLLGFDQTSETPHNPHMVHPLPTVSGNGDGPAETQRPAEWKALLKAKDTIGRTLLHLTALRGYTIATKLMLDEGADPFAMDNDQCMPLHCAAQSGNEDMVKLLVQDPTVLQTPFYRDKSVDYEGKALHHTIVAGHNSVVEFLLSINPSLSRMRDRSGQTPLHIASKTNRTSTMELLISSGVFIDAENFEEQTALCYAILHRADEAVELLLEHGALASFQDAYEATPLHYAAQIGDVSIAKYLLQREKGLVNMQDDRCLTPLHVGAIHG
ncbi:uncharacterized protein N7479_004799 [Penicillium vulpinum]|nr:uncharacterized protein N7479_004799 [Penicillium vulpinum]KAJ5964923.1 hypothetical protein N7479_004799 [Penicillium vulpinum]